MSSVETVFLRHQCGTAIGPLTQWVVEVLWDAHIIDERTPISLDGISFVPIGRHKHLLSHLRNVVDKLDQGEILWPENMPVLAPTEPSASPFTQPPPTPSTLGVLLHHALKRSSGILKLERNSQGTIRLSYRDGKIVRIEVEDTVLSLAKWLVAQKLVNESQISKAQQVADTMGTDLGSALVSSQILSPHIYFDKVIVWSLATLGRCMMLTFDDVHFEAIAIRPPSVPLRFDRFGTLLEAVRESIDRGQLEAYFRTQKHLPLVSSPIQGFTIEDAKPKPRELRILEVIDGTLTLHDILKSLGGTDERNRDILRTIFFATESGLVTFGTDPLQASEEATARTLMAEWATLQHKDLFAFFNVGTRATDQEVHRSYTALAERFHPDTVRKDGAESLRTIKKKLFTYLRDAYQNFDTQRKRDRYIADQQHETTLVTHRHVINPEELIPTEIRLKKVDQLADIGRYSEALEHIHKGLMVSTDILELELSRIYLEYLDAVQRNDDEPSVADTIHMLKQVLDTHGDAARGYHYLGQLYKMTNNIGPALHYYRIALDLDPQQTHLQSEIKQLEQAKHQ